MVEPVNPTTMQRRLQDVAFPLLVAAAGSCPFEQESTYGFFLADHDDRANHQDASGRSSGKNAIVSYVHPQLAAASAGLALGDRIVEVNAKIVEDVDAGRLMELIRRLTAARIQPLQLTVKRGSQPHIITMWAVPACQFTLQLIKSERINGVSNGRHVGVTTGAMQFFIWDDELGWIVAHEIAHNILNHAQDAKLRMMLNTFLGATTDGSALTTKGPEPRSLEAQADYVGSYLMARVGYDLDAIRRVWTRLGEIESHQSALSHEMVQTHPTTAERLAAFEETLKEIEGKRRRGEPLQPQLDSTP